MSEVAEWDFEKLNTELDDIDFDMKEFGFYSDFDENQFEGMFDSEAKEIKEKDPEWKCVFYAETEQQAEDVRMLLEDNGFSAKVER